MKLQALGIDLAKNVFHLVGWDASEQLVIRKSCSRRQVLAFTANVQVEVIGMEACSGAHFLGRTLREQGHNVRLMPAQYVKPYVQTNKRQNAGDLPSSPGHETRLSEFPWPPVHCAAGAMPFGS